VNTEPKAVSRTSDRRIWLVTALGIVAIATAVRFAVNFSSTYPPGTDAAYYPLQTRALMTGGRLMYNDLPLIFWLIAGVTKVLTVIGWESDAALLLASRIVDCVGPPWAAAFVMAAGYDWSGGRRAALAGSAAAATIVVLWPPAFAMLSEFQKNSLGLVWMAAAAWAIAAAMRHGGRQRWATLFVVMVLSALTHIGAFGATAMMVGLALIFWSVPYRRGPGLARWRTALVSVIIVVVPLLILALVEPRRLEVLARGPIEMFGQAGRFGGGGQMIGLTLLFVVPVVVLGLRRVWTDRRELSRADIAIVTAAALTVIAMVVPASSEYARRLSLMSPVPAVTILGFLLARRAVDGRSPWPGRVVVAGVLAIACITVVNARHFVVPAFIDSEEAGDLREMRGQIPEPASTLVIATHGLEWWAGYFLHTPVRVVSMDPQTYGSIRASVPPDAFERYRRVLVIRHAPASQAGRPAAPRTESDVVLHLIRTGRALDLLEVAPSQAGRVGGSARAVSAR
jgi:hypothetical protein